MSPMPIDHVNALPPGTRFEEYRLDAVLGAGGFGITYRAYDGNLEKFVALKEYLPGEFATRTQGYTVVPQSTTDAQDYHWGLNRFLDEARTLARFDHPHLNKVYRFFESNGTAYMVLEYVDGETLADRLTRARQLPEESLLRLLEEVLSGLAVVHKAGYVHRDIKPGNLMLREEDGGVVVLDFGAARQAVGRRSQRLTTILTPGYAPIEQYDSQADDVGPWSDIYALGMVAYRCISGVSDGELPDAVTRGRVQRKGGVDLEPAVEVGKGQYSPRLLEAIDWALEVDEGERPQSVNEWQTALAGGKTRKRTPRTVSKPTARPTTGTTQRVGMRWTTVVLALVIVALLGASAWLGWRAYPELFGKGTGDASVVEEPEVPLDTPGETPQVVETEETGKIVASAEQTPHMDDTPQTAEVEALAESVAPEVKQVASRPTPPAEDDEVTRLLAAAEADLKARRLTSPAGHNAWERYQEVLKLNSSDPEALKGMERVIGSYMELFGAAVEKEDFDKADGYLSRIRDLHPDSPMLEEGEKRLVAARQARSDRLAEIDRQRQTEEAARQAELEQQRIAQAIEAHWAAFDAALEAEYLDEAAGILAQVSDLNPEEPGFAAGEKRLEVVRASLLERQHQADEARARELAGEMVSIPGGTFRMGDLSGEGDDDERPVHSVAVSAFKLGKYEVTFAQWDACVADGGCGRYTPDDGGWSRGTRPVINVSWEDIQLFIDWLNIKSGGNFRLPTEAEWEYAARAGSTTLYSWGNSIGHNRANCAECGSRWDDDRTAPVGSFQANAWGLHDMHGNVWEWVQDCYNDNYVGAPTDNSAWTSGDCGLRVIRGGSWYEGPYYQRSANRTNNTSSDVNELRGFRLAQDK